MTRIALYTRVSTDDQDTVSQEVTLREYAAKKGATIVRDGDNDIFIDHGFSGGNLKRPAFQRLMDAVRRGEVDELAVFKIDRLSRSVIDFLQTLRELARCKTSFTSVTQPFTTATPEGRLMLTNVTSFGEYEREMIANRTRHAAKIRKASGLTFGPAPYGFINKDGKLAPDPATWGHVVALANGKTPEGVHRNTVRRVRKRMELGSYYGVPLTEIRRQAAAHP